MTYEMVAFVLAVGLIFIGSMLAMAYIVRKGRG